MSIERAPILRILIVGGLLLTACSASHKNSGLGELDEDGGAVVEDPSTAEGEGLGRPGAGGSTAGGSTAGGGAAGGGAAGGGAAAGEAGTADDAGRHDDAAATGSMDGSTPGSDAGASPGQDGALPGVDASIPFPTNSSGQVLCGSGPCACSDGLDNDADGVLDLADPECVSSWDNDEGSLATGIPGDNKDDACQDCFFDGNSGSGNDGCKVPTSCILLGNNSSGHGSCSSCEQPAKCQNFCKPYTPNGCDCFGCCEVRLLNGQSTNVLLGKGCSIDGSSITGCTQCVPNPSCNNTCGRCELCPGKTAADLPADCFPAPDSGVPGEPPAPPYTCEGGGAVCGEGLPGCPSDALCQFGCCVLKPLF